MTGLIYVVIIALWAAVLIPIWLRRHDHISEVRSTARFSSAMTKLGTQDRDRAPEPLREARMTPPISARPPEGLDPEYERELIRQAAATRRAIVLGTLTVLLLVTLVLAIVGVLPRWAPVLAALPVVAFVLATAMTASQRSSVRRPKVRSAGSPEASVERAATQATEDDWETWNAWDDDDSWEPVPATLPTYVSAPRASAVPRGIDRAHDGEWSGEAMVETAQAMRGRPRSAPLEPHDVDHHAATAEIPVVRDDYRAGRAVNE